jgi:phosphoesterase RecJ-like protein
MKKLFTRAAALVDSAERIVVVQAENPDADSLGTAMAAGDILTEMGKQVRQYCPIDLPRHLRYIKGWEVVSQELPAKFDLLVIVDAASASLLEKLFVPANAARLQAAKAIIIDHHDEVVDLPLPEPLALIDTAAVASSQVLYELAAASRWPITAAAAEAMIASIMSDSLGLSSVKTTARSVYILAELIERHAVNMAELDGRRREWARKPLDVIRYKGELLQRIEYYLKNRLAMVTVPLGEIEQYSDKYNPSALVLEEMRNAEEVDITVVLKDYGDRITGKLRANRSSVCDKIASHFGGGGHPYASGFKVRGRQLDVLKKELVETVRKAI